MQNLLFIFCNRFVVDFASTVLDQYKTTVLKQVSNTLNKIKNIHIIMLKI